MKELITALVKAKKDFPDIPKNQTASVRMKSGGEYSYKYADLPSILNAVTPHLLAHGLVITQKVMGTTLVTELWHESGQCLDGGAYEVGEYSDPKSMGTAITYAKRYAICGVLGLSPEEDKDDPGIVRQQSGKGQSKPKPQPTPQQLNNDRDKLMSTLREKREALGLAKEQVLKDLGVTNIQDATDDKIRAVIGDYTQQIKQGSKAA